MTQKNNICFIKVLNGKGKSKNIYRIQTKWNHTNITLNLTILDGNKAFQSCIDKTTLKAQADNYEIDFDEYINILQLCLSKSDLDDYTYNIKNNTFLISRCEQRFNRQIADFKLENIDFNVVSINFIDELIAQNDVLLNETLINQEEQRALISEKNNSMDKLQHYINEKEKMENELYSKFILLLNEKKIRIQLLTEIINKHRLNIDNNGIEMKIKSRMESISESESEDEISEQIVHEVQIEVSPKQNDLMECETQEIEFEALPKRISTRSSKNNNVKMSNVSDNSNDNTKKSSQNLEDITNDNETQDLDFNTQDLFDRL